MKEAVIVSGARTPVGKAKKGSFTTVRPDDLGAICVKETLKRAGGYEGNIDDLIIGCATPEAEQGLNMARNIGALAACRTRFRRLQLTVIALQAFSLLHMQQKKLCWAPTIQRSPAEQNPCRKFR